MISSMPGRHIFKRIALHEHRNAAGDLDIFDAAAQFALRLGQGLAVFGGDDRGQLVEMLFEQRLELEKKLHAVRGRRGAPGGESGVGGLDRGVDFCRGACGGVAERIAGCRVEEFEAGLRWWAPAICRR